MVKKILYSTLALLLTGYLVFAVTFVNPKAGEDKKCTGMQIEVVEANENSYLNKSQIESFLKTAKQNPVGKNLSGVSTEAIEKALQTNKLIKETEVYKTIDGTVKVKVYQRTPILRIISNQGNYYVDNEGEIMPVPVNFSAYVPVATGYISETYAKKQLYDFACFLKKNKYWNTQIEQIHVNANLDVEITPREGNQEIILGKIDDYKENLNKLQLFYEKGMDKVGWNKYSIINLKYKNQVVCTKR
jgi:cell division protein FtsQ